MALQTQQTSASVGNNRGALSELPGRGKASLGKQLVTQIDELKYSEGVPVFTFDNGNVD